MLRDSGSEGDAGMCNFWEQEVFSTVYARKFTVFERLR